MHQSASHFKTLIELKVSLSERNKKGTVVNQTYNFKSKGPLKFKRIVPFNLIINFFVSCYKGVCDLEY